MTQEYIPEEQSSESENKFKMLKKRLKICEEERKEYLEGWQRARADFQNYIKQKDSEMAECRKFANEDLVHKIFPILDNLSLAESSVSENMKADSWVIGVLNVRKQFDSILKEAGVSEIEVKKGDYLNPLFHEAVGESESDVEPGKVCEVVQKGYTLHGKVIRAARVRIAK